MDNQVHCPKCNSTQITANKKGFSAGKAVVGALLTGGIGVLAGGIGSGKVIITCLACGHQFKPGAKKETAVEEYHRLKANREKIDAERNRQSALEENLRRDLELRNNPEKRKESRNAVIRTAGLIVFAGAVLWILWPIGGYAVMGFGALLFIAAFV
ncbi:hypothetical protein HF324_12275 [Chitinophaga oryzae]|uniref:Uncharacterized protein n=1 Tax=Chitinophaga oryzae TaxID=2725414 RepID=A0AAE6ZFL1_9BACT|nr:hypothetical protein [Chitinophaga oryzae]QJB32120.1 hypothetical protein HF329_12605 [Chitinophaga oryzae]QJB38597.1 hypothetical protein HF324_12275 [Chitinophaga oryzae]